MQGEIISKWCRENLNELAAEKELRTTRKGTFLVWWCRSLVDLYLSYLDHDGTVHHLPIKQLGRFFFLEGAKFRSLSELVVHHLTMREFSPNPVKIINSQKREKLEATHISLADIDHVPGQPAFCVYRGDLLAEVGRIDDRWLLAKHLPSESIAFFDLTHTSILSDMDAAPEALPYFHECSGEYQDELVQRLVESGRGSFLLRHSRQTPEAYALLVHTGEKIDKFLLEEYKGSCSTHSVRNNNHCPGSAKSINVASLSGWRLSGRVFSSVSQIMHRYSVRPIHSDVRLSHAVLSQARSEQMCSVEHSSNSSPSTYSSVISSVEESLNMRDLQEGERSAVETVLVASVNALYKNREDKEWRECNVALHEHSGTAILRIGDTSRGDRHSLILHHTELVCLHESMLGREATVFLSPLQNEPGVFLAFEPLHFFYTWFHLLRRYTVQRRVDVISSSSSPMSYYSGASIESTEMSVLSMHIDKYKGTLLKPDTLYRVGVSLNGVCVAYTPFQTPTTSSSVVFDAHFLLIVTSWSCDVQLTITAAGKSRPSALSPLFTVPLGGLHTSLLPSGSIATSIASSGAERKSSNGTSVIPFFVSSTRQRVVVLSRDAYTPLLESLLDEVLSVAEWASGKLPPAQRNLLCSVVVSLVWPHSLRALIERTLGKRIGETSGDNVLRQDSFASCLITSALRMSGKTILETNIGEDRPRKEAQSEEWLVGILSEVARTPAVSLVLACVAATVAAHLPAADKEHVVRRAISATLVLRFANPLIIAALATPVGPSLARGVQTAANAATMHNFVRDPSGEETATRLFDLFERVRESAVQTVLVEAYDTAPEQCAILCHLLASAYPFCQKNNRHPTARSVTSSSSSSSSSTLTASSGSSMTSSSSSRLGGAEVSVDAESGCSSSLSSVSSTTAASHDRPELTPGLARLLEMHRS